MRIFGALLIVVGLLALGYRGFTYVPADTSLRTTPSYQTWAAPVAGGAALLAGTALLMTGGRRPELS